MRSPPGLDRSGNALRLSGEAETALDEINLRWDCTGPALAHYLRRDEPEVYQRFLLPKRCSTTRLPITSLAGICCRPRCGRELNCRRQPDDGGCAGNKAAAAGTALREGFNTNALVLTEELVRTWSRAGASPGVVWPTNQVSQWLLKKFVARTPDEWL